MWIRGACSKYEYKELADIVSGNGLSEIKIFLEATRWNSEANVCQKLKSAVSGPIATYFNHDASSSDIEVVLEFIKFVNSSTLATKGLEYVETLLILILLLCRDKHDVIGMILQLSETFSTQKFSMSKVLEAYKNRGGYYFLSDTVLHKTVAITTSLHILNEVLQQLSPTDLIMEKDYEGRTVLHFCKSPEQAKAVINAVPESKRDEFIMAADSYNHNALFYSNKSVVEVLIEAVSQELRNLFIMHKDDDDKTALHYGNCYEIAEVLFKYLGNEQFKEFTFGVDKKGNTWLQNIQDHVDCHYINYLLSFIPGDIKDEFITRLNNEDNTVLHLCKNKSLAEVLLNHVSKEMIDGFIKCCNRRRETVLHKWPSSEVVNYLLLSISKEKRKEFLLSKDLSGETCLFKVFAEHDVRIVMSYLDQESRDELLVSKNNKGETALCAIFNKFYKSLIPRWSYGRMAALLDVAKELCRNVSSENGDELFLSLDPSQLKKIAARNGSLRKLLLIALSKGLTRTLTGVYAHNEVLFDENSVPDMTPESNKPSRGGTTVLQKLDLCSKSLGCTYFERRGLEVFNKDLGIFPAVRSTLHTVCYKWEASNEIKLILESLDPLKREELIFMKENSNKTVLHTACVNKEAHKIIETVLQWLDPQKKEKLIFAKDNEGKNLLHTACVVKKACNIIETVLQSLDPQKREELLLTRDNYERTVLHTACGNWKALKIINAVLQSLDFQTQKELIFTRNYCKQTVLHTAGLSKHASKIIEAVLQLLDTQKKDELILTRDAEDETVLHTACRFWKAYKIVETILQSLDPKKKEELIFIKNNRNRTVLHTACEGREPYKIIKLVLQSLDPQKKQVLIFAKDDEDKTVLHTACRKGDTYEILQLVLQSIDSLKREELIFMKDSRDKTVLHNACESEDAYKVIELVLQSIDPQRRDDLIFTKNVNFAVFRAVLQSRVLQPKDRIDFMIKYISNEKRADLMLITDEYKNTALSMCNSEDQVVAAFDSLGTKDFGIVSQFIFTKMPNVDLSDFFYDFIRCSDEYENTIFTFLTITHNLPLLCSLLSRETLDDRRQYILKQNISGYNCLSLSIIPAWHLMVHMEHFIGHMSAYGTPSRSLSVNLPLIKALHFLCNQYISTPGSAIFLDMSQNSVCNYKGFLMTSSGEMSLPSQFVEAEEPVLEKYLSVLPSFYFILLVDIPIQVTGNKKDAEELVLNSFAAIQELLQAPNLYGKPKVIGEAVYKK